MNPLKKDQLREKNRYMWGCGLRPRPHIQPSLLHAGDFLVHSFMYSEKQNDTQGVSFMINLMISPFYLAG